MRPLFTLAVCALAMGAIAEDAPRRKSLTGHIEHHPGFVSKVMGNTRNLIVYLPPDYDKSPTERFPVLYMHDGQNIFDGMTSYIPNQEWRADETAESMIRAGLIPSIIIVGIDNAGIDRANEYLPFPVQMGDDKAGGRADDYGKFLMTEVMPFINKTYRTKTGPENTALCGSSFGGVVTLHLGLTHPETFGRLGIVSPSLWVGNGVLIDRVAASKKTKQRVWIDMGTLEGTTSLRDLNKLRGAYEKVGFRQGKDLATYVDSGAAHNEIAWAGRFGLILKFLFDR